MSRHSDPYQPPKRESVKKVMFASKDMQLGSTTNSKYSSNTQNQTIMGRVSNMESTGIEQRYEQMGRNDSSIT